MSTHGGTVSFGRSVHGSVRTGRRERGQSVVELALILPVLLLLLLAAIDLGRIYLGWVNLQNMARIAANYAANHASAWEPPITADDLAAQQRYEDLLRNDAKAINCVLPSPLPQPAFPAGTDLSDPAEVRLACQFQVITPVISHIVGGQVLVGASAVFPVKQGVVGGAGGGGGPVVPAPVAEFVASPSSGYAPLTVQLVDYSFNQPTSYTWQFGDGTSSFQREPAHTYRDPGTYTVTLTVANAGGFDIVSHEVRVEAPPTTGPIPEFSASVRSGSPGLQVSFTNRTAGSAVSYRWEFGDGTSSTATSPTKTYSAPGIYTVALTATDATGISNTQTKTAYIIVECVVPNFAGTRKNQAQNRWAAAGFTTQVQFRPGKGNYVINYQSLPGGLKNPPGGCAAQIEVGP